MLAKTSPFYFKASGAPVYLYEFQHRPSAYKNTKPSYVKADHFDEVGFVFGGPFLKGDANYLGKSGNKDKLSHLRLSEPH